MAELILLKPLFAGTDHIDQLTKIFDIVGTPDLGTLDEVCEPCMYKNFNIDFFFYSLTTIYFRCT